MLLCFVEDEFYTREGILASVDWQAYAQLEYDKLAEGLRSSLDMEQIYRILNGER